MQGFDFRFFCLYGPNDSLIENENPHPRNDQNSDAVISLGLFFCNKLVKFAEVDLENFPRALLCFDLKVFMI